MRFSSLLTNGMSSLICAFILMGCATGTSGPSREAIVFQYTPQSEAASGSADVTFAVVGTQLAKSVEQGQMQLPNQKSVKLFTDFAGTMTKDFMEVLGAQGFGVRGPFNTYEDMIFPDKQGSDLVLTAEVLFSTDTSSCVVKNKEVLGMTTEYYRIIGSVTVKYDVKLVASESLTNERMWTKTINIDPFTIQLESQYSYTLQQLATLSMKYGKVYQPNSEVPIGAILENEHKFHNDLGRALQKQYKDILGKIYTYLDPREMTVVKNQAIEIRKKKVF